MSPSMIRVRFAPSPTGQVHIGNIRTAIFNWLFARHEGGRFLLRIEDTDRERSTPEAIGTLLDVMAWMGLDIDEPPLYQSHRRERHLAAAEELLRRDLAYRSDKGAAGKGEAILFRMPQRDAVFDDMIRGRLVKPAASLQDFVIVRSDGQPVFHLANVVDDIDMAITHVIRGDDHVENTYRHIQLFEALGAARPVFAHLPMLVNDQGKPFSKRDGDAFVGDFRTKGYLPQALFNFLALLGWSPGDDREYMPRPEMIEAFDLRRVKPSPAQLNLQKLDWMNGCYMADLPRAEFAEQARPILRAAALVDDTTDPAYLRRVLELVQDRIKIWSDLADATGYLLRDEYPHDDKAVRKRLVKDGVPALLAALAERYRAQPAWDAAALERELRAVLGEGADNAAQLIHPVRVAVTGRGAGPGLFEILELLGRDRVLRRLERGIDLARAGLAQPAG